MDVKKMSIENQIKKVQDEQLKILDEIIKIIDGTNALAVFNVIHAFNTFYEQQMIKKFGVVDVLKQIKLIDDKQQEFNDIMKDCGLDLK